MLMKNYIRFTAKDLEEAFDLSEFGASQVMETLREIRPDVAISRIAEVIGGYGAESIRSFETWDRFWGDSIACYVNMGDCYNTTILFSVVNDEFQLTTVGDFVETNADLVA